MEDFAPDTHTPVVVNGKVFGVHDELFCLDIAQGLKPCWSSDEDAYLDYTTVIGSVDHILIMTLGGELILVSTNSEEYQVVDRLQLVDDGTPLHAHPAIVGQNIYLRIGKTIACLSLSEAEPSSQP